MSRDREAASPRIDGVDELTQIFRQGEKPRVEHRVGAELERLAYDAQTLAPVPYEPGIHGVLTGLQAFGWKPVAGPTLVALERGAASVSLEPGGQAEIAGTPSRSVHEVTRELTAHARELYAVGRDLGLRFSTLAFRPFETPADMPWMPKERYRIMRAYLPTRGGSALDMMTLSATVQGNFDYVDEADMVATMRAAMGVSPVVSAIFCNSPFQGGAWRGLRSRRYAMWRDVDPDRCGLLPFVFDEDFGYRRYAEWALDVPMFFIRREGRYLPARGLTFRRFIQEGLDGERANLNDFENHVSTLFPEVRLKRVIEVRGVDAGPLPYASAMLALWKGLLYDAEARRDVTALMAPLSMAQRAAMQHAVAQDGLRAHGPGFYVGELAREVVRLARAGLSRQAERDEWGRDEGRFLDVLAPHLDELETLADRLIARFGPGPWDAATRRRLLDESAYAESVAEP